MTEERWLEIRNEGGVIDLSRRAKWLLTGEDRERYLNGQVTQNVTKATSKKAIYACVTDAKGRVCGDVFVRRTEDGQGLLVDTEEQLRETLILRLNRYIVADDVEIQDVTDDWNLEHRFGADGGGESDGCECERFGVVGRDVWTPRSEVERPVFQALTDDEVEVLRVLNGIARYPNELNDEVFPPEAGVEARAIDYAKGCYIGQEVLSRIRTSRKMPRELVAWRLNSDGVGLRGDTVAVPGDGGRVVGLVTSAVIDPETGRSAGLAFVKLGSVPDDSQLLVGNHFATIRRLVSGLPL